MAIHEEIIIDVTDNGMAQATQKANALADATKRAGEESEEMSRSMSSSANSVLENGGAMGLLNDLTGGYAMMVKDAVEASVLFTKSQKLAAIQQKIYTLVMGTSTGAMKAFRIALISTGIGAIVVAVGLLIANFDKVKKVVMNLIPGMAIIGKVIGGIVDAITDFVGVTSDATRALDSMVENADKSLKKNEYLLDVNADKYDEYTKRKIQANIDYNKKVKELAEDETLTDQEKLDRIAAYRDKANRQIDKADADRQAERDKKRKEAADKEAEENKKLQEKIQREKDLALQKEKERTDAISKLLEDYRKKAEDAEAKSETQKINLEEKRALAELDRLKATEAQKKEIRDYYDNLKKEDAQRIADELAAIEQSRIGAQRNLELDQKQWEIDNEVDPVVKLAKEKEYLNQQAFYQLEALQKQIDNAQLSAIERANAEFEYAKVKQDLDQALADKNREISELQKGQDESVANNKKQIATQTIQSLFDIAGKGSELAKGMAAAQAIQDTYKGATAAYSSLAGIPIVGPALGAAAAGVAIASGLLNVKKILATKQVEKSAPSAGGGGAGVPSAPSFNLVQGTGANQIAEAVAGQNTPIKAYVVSSDVSDAQELDRNIISNSTI
jgi:hypothetical protein